MDKSTHTTEPMELRVRRKVAEKLYNDLYKDNLIEENGSAVEEVKTKSLKEKLTVGNLLWILSAAVLFYSSDIVTVSLFDERVKRGWFYIGSILILLNLSIAGFLIVYAGCIKKIDSDNWEVHYPSAIPIATASFIFGSVCLMISLWPIYNYFTPVILFCIFMGFVVLVSWLP